MNELDCLTRVAKLEGGSIMYGEEGLQNKELPSFIHRHH